MTLGRYESDRPRRSLLGRIFRLALAAAVLGGIGLFAFQLGIEDERGRQGRLADETIKLGEANQQFAQANAQLRTQLQGALDRLKDVEGVLGTTTKVSDAARILMPAIEKKLAEGADPKRLAEALAAMDRPRDCEAPENKRFLVRTGLTAEGPNTSVGFAGGLVTVTGQGVNAKSAEGKAEAWFDPAEPVTIRFIQIGGRAIETVGKLPIHHTLAVGPAEHRFSVMAAARGFVQVTSERCKVQ